MAPWETIKKLKEMTSKLTAEGAAGLSEEVVNLLGVLASVVESQQHDLQVMKATVARLEHHVRHKHVLQ